MNAQENVKNDSITNVQKPKFEDTFKEQVSPNTIHFEGRLINKMSNTVICNKKHKYVALIEVVKVTAKGSGLINAFGKGATQKMVFFMGFDEVMQGEKVMFKGIKKGDTFNGIASEKLCTDGNETYYMVSSYQNHQNVKN